jgi:protein gp37
MSDVTKIEWTDHTWSPWEGCQKVGPGCDHCYAEARNARFAGGGRPAPNWGPGAPRRRTADWTKPRLWNRQAERDGVRRRIFPSLCDPFDNEVDPAWRADLFALIAATPRLDWLLLTKRIGNAHQMIGEALITLGVRPGGAGPTSLLPLWPWANVWLMATMVNQAEYDRDIGKLLRTPAVVHGISIEPMLGAMDLRLGGASLPDYAQHHPLAPLDWVIVGGESGREARPMHPNWARSLRDQCARAGVPLLFKQHGEWAPGNGGPGGDLYPVDRTKVASGFFDYCDRWNALGANPFRQTMDRIGKKAAGRLLDGVKHNGFPEARHG